MVRVIPAHHVYFAVMRGEQGCGGGRAPFDCLPATLAGWVECQQAKVTAEVDDAVQDGRCALARLPSARSDWARGGLHPPLRLALSDRLHHSGPAKRVDPPTDGFGVALVASVVQRGTYYRIVPRGLLSCV